MKHYIVSIVGHCQVAVESAESPEEAEVFATQTLSTGDFCVDDIETQEINHEEFIEAMKMSDITVF